MKCFLIQNIRTDSSQYKNIKCDFMLRVFPMSHFVHVVPAFRLCLQHDSIYCHRYFRSWWCIGMVLFSIGVFQVPSMWFLGLCGLLRTGIWNNRDISLFGHHGSRSSRSWKWKNSHRFSGSLMLIRFGIVAQFLLPFLYTSYSFTFSLFVLSWYSSRFATIDCLYLRHLKLKSQWMGNEPPVLYWINYFS